MAYELNHLRHFYEVVRRGGFSRAARALRIQQPAVSRSVRLLEEGLGLTLLQRSVRGATPTAAGARVYASCVRIFAEAEDLERIADDERGACRGPLRIAAGGAIGSRLVPDLIAEILREHPRLWPMIFSGPATMAFDRILARELELGLYFYTPRPPASLTCVALADAPFRLVVRADRARDRAVCESFIGSREVEDDRADRFPTLEHLRKKYPGAAIRISTNDAEAHLRLVEAGLGVSILPSFMVDAGIADGRLTPLFPEVRFRFPVLLVTRRHHVLSRGACALLDGVAAALGAEPDAPPR